MKRAVSRSLLTAAILALTAVAMVPVLDRTLARREARELLAATQAVLDQHARRGERARPLRCAELEGTALLRNAPQPTPLASWGYLGGCGAGGGSGAVTGGAKWIGRGVTGGLVDLQCLASQAFTHQSYFTTINTRLGTAALPRWGFGLNVPILFKAGPVTVLGQERTAQIAGFGDLSLEVSRKLGVSGSTQLTMMASAPVGAWDAVRQGAVLPQHLQLGSGALGLTAQVEHTLDRDWGLFLLGGSASYNGWENSLGDYRSPNATAYAYAAYRIGPLMPAAGLTLFGKLLHDRERGADRPEESDPLAMLVPSLSLEWSTDVVALLLYASSSFSYHGFETASLSLGISSSLF